MSDDEELPLNSGADVFIELHIFFPNTDLGFKISEISVLDSEYMKIQKLLEESAVAIIGSLKKEWLISSPIIYFKPDETNCEAGYKLCLRKKKIFKQLMNQKEIANEKTDVL